VPLDALRRARDEGVDDVFSSRIPELAYLRRVKPDEFKDVPIDASEKEIALSANKIHFETHRSVVDRARSDARESRSKRYH
jgi:hypothetical protein